ncbi:MAG TPA: TSUP family transporter, partial [Myxococcota bacterium]|nr:TSUP family transporter [Myxococcota bacterium]
MSNTAEHIKATNSLLPVFMKLEQMRVLLVGAGNVALEKLKTIKGNAPRTRICVVAKEISKQFADYVSLCEHVELIQDNYSINYLKNVDVVFSAVNDHVLSAQIFADAEQDGKLCNSADKPELCHFYLSSVVTKGDLKIAISTNGKSPTMARRLKEVLQHALPSQLDDVVQNLHIIRRRLNGNFQQKVQRLNELTRIIVEDEKGDVADKGSAYSIVFDTLWKRIMFGCLFALFFIVSGHALLSLLPLGQWMSKLQSTAAALDYPWITVMFLTGFVAQFADGMLGMGFGIIATTVLLSAGVSPAIVSSRVHATRMFSSGLSGYSHHKLGNINKRLFKTLAIPGCIGAIIGAVLACLAGEKHAYWVRPLLSIYTLFLGVRIFRKAFVQKKAIEKIRKAGWLAMAGGLLDAFAGGGWGSLVTSTLISKTKNPRMVIGSVCLAEFFVVLVSTLIFFLLLPRMPLQDVSVMIMGGLLAAPLAASLAGKLPHKYLYLLIG